MKRFLGNLFVVVPEKASDDFRYTQIGTAITEHVGIDNAGRNVGEIFGPSGLELYCKVWDERRPIRGHAVVEWRRKEHLGYESLLLPLADNFEGVDHFVGMMVFGPAACCSKRITPVGLI